MTQIIYQVYDHLVHRSGIYQVYTCHMKTKSIYLVYTRYMTFQEICIYLVYSWYIVSESIFLKLGIYLVYAWFNPTIRPAAESRLGCRGTQILDCQVFNVHHSKWQPNT